MQLQQIELTNLDTILTTHAYEFQEATGDLPLLRREMASFKVEVERVEASLYIQIRKGYEDSGDKFTEAKISAAIKSDKLYLDSQEAYLTARQAHDEIDHLRSVFMQRESSIKALVSLYHAQYWSLGGIETMPQAKPANPDGKPAFKERA